MYSHNLSETQIDIRDQVLWKRLLFTSTCKNLTIYYTNARLL